MQKNKETIQIQEEVLDEIATKDSEYLYAKAKKNIKKSVKAYLITITAVFVGSTWYAYHKQLPIIQDWWLILCGFLIAILAIPLRVWYEHKNELKDAEDKANNEVNENLKEYRNNKSKL